MQEVEEGTNYCALDSISDAQVRKVIRAFWRRIYCYRNDYGIELPDPMPVEFMAHMATALMWVDKKDKLSDLEIVQKALEKSGSMIRIYPDGSATIVSADKNNRAVFSELADVLQALTWAKQTIGEQG